MKCESGDVTMPTWSLQKAKLFVEYLQLAPGEAASTLQAAVMDAHLYN